MTKAPKPGQVKTRLAKDIGAEAAAQIHREMVLETIRRACATGFPVVVSLALGEDGEFSRVIRQLGATVEPQASGDLGARLAHAMRHPGLSIALGTDCVIFEPEWLVAAAQTSADVSIGASADGGYWAIALDGSRRKLSSTVFSDMPWSTPQLLAATVKALSTSGFTSDTMPDSYDVDELTDLQRLRDDSRCPGPLKHMLAALL